MESGIISPVLDGLYSPPTNHPKSQLGILLDLELLLDAQLLAVARGNFYPLRLIGYLTLFLGKREMNMVIHALLTLAAGWSQIERSYHPALWELHCLPISLCPIQSAATTFKTLYKLGPRYLLDLLQYVPAWPSGFSRKGFSSYQHRLKPSWWAAGRGGSRWWCHGCGPPSRRRLAWLCPCFLVQGRQKCLGEEFLMCPLYHLFLVAPLHPHLKYSLSPTMVCWFALRGFYVVRLFHYVIFIQDFIKL